MPPTYKEVKKFAVCNDSCLLRNMNPLKREGATAKAMDGPVTRPSFMFVKNEGQVHLERQHRTMELSVLARAKERT